MAEGMEMPLSKMLNIGKKLFLGFEDSEFKLIMELWKYQNLTQCLELEIQILSIIITTLFYNVIWKMYEGGIGCFNSGSSDLCCNGVFCICKWLLLFSLRELVWLQRQHGSVEGLLQAMVSLLFGYLHREGQHIYWVVGCSLFIHSFIWCAWHGSTPCFTVVSSILNSYGMTKP